MSSASIAPYVKAAHRINTLADMKNEAVNPNAPLKYRADIDGLRGIAVSLVVAFHAFPNWAAGGYIGVDIFFVISGYLISGIIFRSLDENKFSFADFYMRRVRRIFPALAFVLLACLAAGWFVLLPDEFKQLGKHIAGGAGFVSNLVLRGESGYFGNASEMKPLLHLWSLGIEEQFYIFWPLLLYFAWKRKYSLLWMTLGILSVSFILNISRIYSDGVSTFYSPETRIWELLMGGALAYYELRNTAIGKTHRIDGSAGVAGGNSALLDTSLSRNVKSVAGLLFIVAAAMTFTKEMAFPGWWAILPTLGTFFLISAGSQAWINRGLLSRKVIVWIGLISYPLYLWHWPLLSFAHILDAGMPSRNIRIAAVLMGLILASATYVVIERPFRFGKHAGAKLLALCASMICVAATGLYAFHNDGFSSRFAVMKDIEKYNLWSQNITDEWRRYRCMLEKENTFGEECVERNPNGPLMFLWGDSHAAALYPGFHRRQVSHGIGLAQFTAGMCPPIFNYASTRRDFNNPGCADLNKIVASKLDALKPDVLIMTAYWEEYDLSALDATFTRLKQMKINNVVLIGSVPDAPKSLRREVLNAARRQPLRREPITFARYINDHAQKADDYVQKKANEYGYRFISSSATLCDNRQCLAVVGNELTYTDDHHLSPVGADYLIGKLWPSIAKDTALPLTVSSRR